MHIRLWQKCDTSSYSSFSLLFHILLSVSLVCMWVIELTSPDMSNSGAFHSRAIVQPEQLRSCAKCDRACYAFFSFFIPHYWLHFSDLLLSIVKSHPPPWQQQWSRVSLMWNFSPGQLGSCTKRTPAYYASFSFLFTFLIPLPWCTGEYWSI